MLRLSVNILSNVLNYLKEIYNTENFTPRKTDNLYRSYSVSSDSLFELASSCRWIETTDGYINVTRRGKQIISQIEYGLTTQLLTLMLHDYVVNIRPIWANRILYGRKEAFIFMTKDEKACFIEAGLMNEEISMEIVEWWDHISTELRKSLDEQKNMIGRDGEKITIKYEYERIGERPFWISIDSNLAGYDLISRTEPDKDTKMLIEVKASSLPISQAEFHITKNEWQVAKTVPCYRFYVWCLSNVKSLAIISPEELESMIPINQKTGEWETVKIPFSAFSKIFQVVYL